MKTIGFSRFSGGKDVSEEHKTQSTVGPLKYEHKNKKNNKNVKLTFLLFFFEQKGT